MTKQLFTLSYEQAAGTPSSGTQDSGEQASSMAHALVPHASARQLAAYAAHGPRSVLSVLSNTVRLQAATHTRLGITAANAFTPGTHRVGRLSIDGPASVMLRRTGDGRYAIAVSDPTTTRRTVSVTLHGRALRSVSADTGVRVRHVPGGTRIDVTTHHAYGRSFTATLTEGP